jgi:hypothetical protein
MEVRNYDSPDPKAVVQNLDMVLRELDMTKLSKKAYQFLTTHCGFIAHYDHAGFIATYREDLPSFIDEFLSQLGAGWDTWLNNSKSHLYDVSYRGVLLAYIVRQLIPLFVGARERAQVMHDTRIGAQKYAMLESLAEELGYTVVPKR